MGMHIERRIAGRTFKAKCGCTIQKGEMYVAWTDFVMGLCRYHSSCVECWNGQSGIKVLNGELVLEA